MNRNKGSYRRMRLISNNKDYTVLLKNKMGIEGTLRWICPTENGNEYQLNSKEILDELKFPPDAFDEFWPKRQPQWDGIAYLKETKTLYLFEAKSHKSEISCGNRLDNPNNEIKSQNYDLKCKSLKEAMKSMVEPDEYEDAWLHQYYQISNRLAFLLKLKELCPTEIIKDVKLIFLNFVDDLDWAPENKQMSCEQWKEKYNKIYESMGISEAELNEIGAFVINFDTKQITE